MVRTVIGAVVCSLMVFALGIVSGAAVAYSTANVTHASECHCGEPSKCKCADQCNCCKSCKRWCGDPKCPQRP